jgi:phosphate starvation-inducible membrane PsiE
MVLLVLDYGLVLEEATFVVVVVQANYYMVGKFVVDLAMCSLELHMVVDHNSLDKRKVVSMVVDEFETMERIVDYVGMVKKMVDYYVEDID